MCMGCMANADFALTSGILGAASVRVGLRRYLPGQLLRRRRVTDQEVCDFVASLEPIAEEAAPGAPARDEQLV